MRNIMFIQTETTPNPLTLKFIPGVEVCPDYPIGFTKQEEAAKKSPLADTLLSISEVTGVFLGSDFISVTKSEESDWNLLKAEVLTAIMEHFVAGKPVMHDASVAQETEKSGDTSDDNSENSDIIEEIKELIETRVRPSVAQDGGDIIFRGFKDGVVQLELHGACSGCPSAAITLKDGIENMLKYYVPEVESVEAIE